MILYLFTVLEIGILKILSYNEPEICQVLLLLLVFKIEYIRLGKKYLYYISLLKLISSSVFPSLSTPIL